MRATMAGALLLIVGTTAAACLLEVDDPHGAGGAGSGASSDASSASGGGPTASSASGGGSTDGGPPGCGAGTVCVEGTWVILTELPCPAGSKPVSVSACDTCACQAMGSGNCTLDGKVAVCGPGGASADFPTPNANKCFDLGTASGANVWTKLDTGQCNVIQPTVASNTRNACELVGSGSCGVGGSCVQANLAAMACEELAGVNSCPAGLPYWAHISTAPSASCTCACDPCGDISVTVYPQKGCQGTGVVIGADGQCKESGLAHINSVQTPPTKPITCLPRGNPLMATERLCCPAPL